MKQHGYLKTHSLAERLPRSPAFIILKLYTLVSSSTTTLYSLSSTVVSPVTFRRYPSAVYALLGPSTATTPRSNQPLKPTVAFAASAESPSSYEDDTAAVVGMASISRGGQSQLSAGSPAYSCGGQSQLSPASSSKLSELFSML